MVDRFFSYVLSDVYKDRQVLVNAMANTKVYTHQWIYDQTVAKMVEINSSYSSADNILIQIKLMLISIVVIITLAALIFTTRILLQAFFNLFEAVYKRIYLLIYRAAPNKHSHKSNTKTLISESEMSSESTTQVKPPSLFVQNRIGRLDKRFLDKYKILEFVYEIFRGSYVFLVISLLATRVGLLSFNYFMLMAQVHNQLKDLCIGLLSHTQTVVGASQSELDVLFVMLSERMTCWNANYAFLMSAPQFKFCIGLCVIVCHTFVMVKVLAFLGFNKVVSTLRDLTANYVKNLWDKALVKLGIRRPPQPPEEGPALDTIAVVPGGGERLQGAGGSGNGPAPDHRVLPTIRRRRRQAADSSDDYFPLGHFLPVRPFRRIPEHEDTPPSPGASVNDALHMPLRPNPRRAESPSDEEIIYNRAHGIDTHIVERVVPSRSRSAPEDGFFVSAEDSLPFSQINGVPGPAGPLVIADSPFGGAGFLQ